MRLDLDASSLLVHRQLYVFYRVAYSGKIGAAGWNILILQRTQQSSKTVNHANCAIHLSELSNRDKLVSIPPGI